MSQPGMISSNYPSVLKLVLVSAVLFAMFYLFDKTPFAYNIENQMSLPSLFKIRDQLGKSGELHQNMKLFSYDDTTLGKLGKPDLTIEEWAILLKKLSLKKPRAIFIDKLFALNSLIPEENIKAAEILESIDVPVVTISFVTPSKLKYRKSLELEHERYRLLSLYESKLSLMYSPFVVMNKAIGSYVYGPHESLQPYFKKIGHALNADQGKATPLMQIGPQTILPHMAFVGPFRLRVEKGRLFSGKTPIPIDVKGKVVVDFFERSQYFKRNIRLLSVLNQIARNKPISQVNEGDIVLILPSMFTGGTDFIRTPLGPMPGGYVIASMLNSMVRGDWIKPTEWNNAALLLACVLGVPIVFLVGAWFWIYIATCLLVYCGIAVTLFAYFGVLINVSLPIAAFLTSLFTFITFRNQVREKLMFFMRVLKTENDELRHEIDHASQIARVFNPESAPRWKGLAISAHHETLINASGDWYAFEKSPSGDYHHILMCDITGHGVQAAIIVSACKTVLSVVTKQYPEFLEGLDFFERYIRLLNSTLYSQGRGMHITTMVGISVCQKTDQICHITAGHPPALLFRKKKDGEELKLTALNSRHNPLGFFPEINPTSKIVDFNPGDTLVIYTDGVPMPRNPKSLRRPIKNLVDAGIKGLSATNLLEKIKTLPGNDLIPHMADDVSLVMIHYREEQDQIESSKTSKAS